MGAQAKEIASWLKEEGSLPSSAELADAIEKHPYASILHFAYLRSLQNEDSYKFPSQLHRTALTAMNRKALLDWAESPLIPVEVQAAAWKEAQKSSQQTESKAKESAPKAESSVAEVVPVTPELPEASPVQKSPEAPPIAAPSSPSTSSGATSVERIEPTPAKPVVTKPVVAKPAAATDLSSINLDALPPAVREQILRSRAIQAQLGKGSPATVASAAPAAPATPVVPDSPLTSAAPSASPASATAPSAEHKEKPLAVAPVVEGSKTPVPSAEPRVKTKDIAAVPASTADVPAENASDAAKVAVAPEVPESPLPSAAPSVPPASELAPPPKERSPDPTLSPFANFLAGLKEGAPQTAVPAGQRDPAMERAILEQFLEINPKIKPVRDAPMGENLALRTPNVSGLVTETLANHYYDQGMTEKAIQAYEILKLKVPEKSVIFAARISEMRKTQSSTK